MPENKKTAAQDSSRNSIKIALLSLHLINKDIKQKTILLSFILPKSFKKLNT